MAVLAYHKKKFSINFSKANTKCYNGNNCYLFVNGKKSISLKLIIKILTFKLNFDAIDSEKYVLEEICMIFQLITMLLINLTF